MTLGVALEAASCAPMAWRSGSSGTRSEISSRPASAPGAQRTNAAARSRRRVMVGNVQSIPRLCLPSGVVRCLRSATPLRVLLGLGCGAPRRLDVGADEGLSAVGKPIGPCFKAVALLFAPVVALFEPVVAVFELRFQPLG